MKQVLRTILTVGALLLALIAIFLTLSVRKRVSERPEAGNSAPNLADNVDRVKDNDERARMERYVAELQGSKTIIASFSGLSGETIDCVDVYSQPALKRPGMEQHKITFAPASLPHETRERRSGNEELLRTPAQLYTLSGETCPGKSVPMERLTMETLKRFRTL